MLNYYSWTLYGYPEEPLPPDRWDVDASPTFEDFTNELQALIRERARHPIEMLLQAHSGLLLPTSPHQRFRFWFLLGRAHIVCRKWDEALIAFEHCHSIALATTALMQIHLFRSWGYAAQEALQYETAFSKYERLADLVAAQLQQGHDDFIKEDAYCFLCNLYRNQAYTRLWVCAPDAARAILEHKAIPLLKRAHEPFNTSMRDQDRRNWRELHLFFLWTRGIVIDWQARLSDDPGIFDQDLYEGFESVLVAAKISQDFPEGQMWTPDLYSLAAEMCLMRCDLASNRNMQIRLCELAEEQLQLSLLWRHDDLTTLEGQLHALTLDFSRYELAVRQHILFDTVDRMDHVITDLIALRQRTEAVADASYRLFTSRCLLLLGDVEIALQEFAAAADVTHAQRADAYLQQGLDLLDRRAEAKLDGLFEREILKKKEHLQHWFESYPQV